MAVDCLITYAAEFCNHFGPVARDIKPSFCIRHTVSHNTGIAWCEQHYSRAGHRLVIATQCHSGIAELSVLKSLYVIIVKLLVDEGDIYIGIVFAYSDDSLRNRCVFKRIGIFVGTG